jgi:hypothetical protein
MTAFNQALSAPKLPHTPSAMTANVFALAQVDDDVLNQKAQWQIGQCFSEKINLDGMCFLRGNNVKIGKANVSFNLCFDTVEAAVGVKVIIDIHT